MMKVLRIIATLISFQALHAFLPCLLSNARRNHLPNSLRFPSAELRPNYKQLHLQAFRLFSKTEGNEDSEGGDGAKSPKTPKQKKPKQKKNNDDTDSQSPLSTPTSLFDSFDIGNLFDLGDILGDKSKSSSVGSSETLPKEEGKPSKAPRRKSTKAEPSTDEVDTPNSEDPIDKMPTYKEVENALRSIKEPKGPKEPKEPKAPKTPKASKRSRTVSMNDPIPNFDEIISNVDSSDFSEFGDLSQVSDTEMTDEELEKALRSIESGKFDMGSFLMEDEEFLESTLKSSVQTSDVSARMKSSSSLCQWYFPGTNYALLYPQNVQ